MPAVFYILGILFAAVCANFTFAAMKATSFVTTEVEIANFQLAHSTSLTIALGAGIISALMFSTGAVIETLRRNERDPE